MVFLQLSQFRWKILSNNLKFTKFAATMNSVFFKVFQMSNLMNAFRNILTESYSVCQVEHFGVLNLGISLIFGSSDYIE